MVLYSMVIISHLFSRCKCKEFFYLAKENVVVLFKLPVFLNKRHVFEGFPLVLGLILRHFVLERNALLLLLYQQSSFCFCSENH